MEGDVLLTSIPREDPSRYLLRAIAGHCGEEDGRPRESAKKKPPGMGALSVPRVRTAST